jgi:hypothetical protein
MKDSISIRGKRDLWLEFIHKTKKEKKKAWEVLSPYLRKFIDSDEENRVLLLHFPRELANELMKKENPDRFIEESIRKNLALKK